MSPRTPRDPATRTPAGVAGEPCEPLDDAAATQQGDRPSSLPARGRAAGRGTPAAVAPLVTAAGPEAPGAAGWGSLAAPGTRMARRWLLEMPPGMLLLNANQRLHWSEKGRRVKALREASMVLARNARVPLLKCARVVVEYQPPRKSRARDAGNWAPTGKALIDGLRDARVLPDDDSSHLLSEEYRIGPVFEHGRMLLHITEVTGDRKLPGEGT